MKITLTIYYKNENEKTLYNEYQYSKVVLAAIPSSLRYAEFNQILKAQGF